MIPDKIYTDNRGVYAELPIFSQIDANVEYIRKDALLEWANNWLSFERSGIGLDKGFAHAMKIMIDKLNSM